jgi:hypothetical protein
MIPDALRHLPWQGDITAEPLLGGLSNESWKVTDGRGNHVDCKRRHCNAGGAERR